MFTELTDADIEQLNYSQQPLGPSSRNCCKVSNGNVCGSGSLVGVRDGKSLVLSNAHVCSTRIGKTMSCTFPFAGNARVGARLIMAGYSDKIMADWAILELDTYMNELPHVKLSIETPSGEHYTGGYPRCKGPYFQKIITHSIPSQYKGFVWQWNPPSIGGQSGSGVHSFGNDLQYGLLTWLWAGRGAGQTTRAIWFQYVNRCLMGFARPDDLIELNDNRAEDLESGLFFESNITTLPIWAHLDDEDKPEPEDPEKPDEPPNPKLVEEVKASAARLSKEAAALTELARKYGGGSGGEDEDEGDSGGTLFGL